MSNMSDAPSPDPSQAQILIVEDEAIIAEGIARRLRSMGYGIVGIAYSGEEAVAQAGARKPDLVLMDIRLHGKMDGIEAAARIRDRLDIPSIYLTGYADEVTLDRIKATTPLGLLRKPIEARELRSVIELALYQLDIERKLRESEARFRALFELSPDAILLADASTGRIVDANPSAAGLLGRPVAQIVGMHFQDLHPPDQWEQTRADSAYRPGIWGQDALPVEIDILRADGIRKTVEIRGQTIPLHGQEYVLGAFRDVTERIRMRQALQASEERYRLLLERAGLGIGYYDLEGRILFLNDKACRYLQTRPESLVGRPAEEVFGPEMGHLMRERIAAALASSEALRYRDEVDLPVGKRQFLSTYSHIVDDAGNSRGVQIISHEIAVPEEDE
jgi:PAS domain S-box-containing protein